MIFKTSSLFKFFLNCAKGQHSHKEFTTARNIILCNSANLKTVLNKLNGN